MFEISKIQKQTGSSNLFRFFTFDLDLHLKLLLLRLSKCFTSEFDVELKDYIGGF
jgi:hypothetical protein